MCTETLFPSLYKFLHFHTAVVHNHQFLWEIQRERDGEIDRKERKTGRRDGRVRERESVAQRV